MEEVRRKPRVSIVSLLIVVIFTIAGFFVGKYYTEKRLEREREIPIVTDYLPAERHIESLMYHTGWENPEEKIIEDLVTRPELIPYDPVLGGTMGFYDRDNIHLLNNKWVLAAFEDGHIGGYALLEFEIDQDRKIDWQVIGSFLE